MANVTEVTMETSGPIWASERAEMRWSSTPARCAATAALAFATALLPAGTGAAAAAGGPQWASANSATIHPGVGLSMGGVTCRAGFIFTDGTHAFIAVPASCSGTGPADNSKCDVGQDPVGTPV